MLAFADRHISAQVQYGARYQACFKRNLFSAAKILYSNADHQIDWA